MRINLRWHREDQKPFLELPQTTPVAKNAFSFRQCNFFFFPLSAFFSKIPCVRETKTLWIEHQQQSSILAVIQRKEKSNEIVLEEIKDCLIRYRDEITIMDGLYGQKSKHYRAILVKIIAIWPNFSKSL